MPRLPLIAVLASAIGLFAGPVPAQQQAPASDASQPQKKPPAPKPQASSSTSTGSSSAQPGDQPASAQKDNPFPESVSRDAAKAAQHPTADDNPFPEDVSRDAADAAKHNAGDDNPFPEKVSRDAAKAAGDSNAPDASPASLRKLPPGISSSRSTSGDLDSAGMPQLSAGVTDPARTKKDTDVGSFYMRTGNYRGAYLRYQDALAGDPSNVKAIFGLAESARELKQYAEAQRNYQLYLQILPNGPEAKKAAKELSLLPLQK